MSAASVVVEGATSPAFFHLSGPGSDLAIGTVIIALLVACAALSNQEWSWLFRRQKAWRRSNSWPTSRGDCGLELLGRCRRSASAEAGLPVTTIVSGRGER